MNQNKVMHVSFDFWRTLFKSNELFSSSRIKLIYEDYNPNKLPLSKISSIIENIGERVDQINAITFESISSSEMNTYLLLEMGVRKCNIDINNFENKINNLFLDNPPTLINSKTDLIFAKLINYGVTISIASNTAYIKGDTLSQLLNEFNLSEYFNFQLYSDNLNLSKPSPKFFSKVYSSAKVVNEKINFRTNVLHIGDNYFADIEGANSFGFRSFQINTNEYLINDIFNEANNFGFQDNG